MPLNLENLPMKAPITEFFGNFKISLAEHLSNLSNSGLGLSKVI